MTYDVYMMSRLAHRRLRQIVQKAPDAIYCLHAKVGE